MILKRLLWFGLLHLLMMPVQAQYHLDHLYDDLDTFLGMYVQDGLVDYKAIKANPTELKALLQRIEHAVWKDFAPLDQQAFLINAYNILVIASVTTHYPIQSPLDVGGFFDREEHHVGGQSVTLDQLEKGILFTTFRDPRFHFALVCAAKGCPILMAEPYRGNQLTMQLDTQTKSALNNDLHVYVDTTGQKVQLSQLFEWYKADFSIQGKTVLSFVNQYRQAEIPASYSIRYKEYDWRLNELP